MLTEANGLSMGSAVRVAVVGVRAGVEVGAGVDVGAPKLKEAGVEVGTVNVEAVETGATLLVDAGLTVLGALTTG